MLNYGFIIYVFSGKFMLRFCSKNHFDYIPASITFGTKKIKYKSSVFLSLLDKQESDLNNLRLHARSGGVMFFSMHSTLLAQYTCWFNPFSFIYIYIHTQCISVKCTICISYCCVSYTLHKSTDYYHVDVAAFSTRNFY